MLVLLCVLVGIVLSLGYNVERTNLSREHPIWPKSGVCFPQEGTEKPAVQAAYDKFRMVVFLFSSNFLHKQGWCSFNLPWKNSGKVQTTEKGPHFKSALQIFIRLHYYSTLHFLHSFHHHLSYQAINTISKTSSITTWTQTWTHIQT